MAEFPGDSPMPTGGAYTSAAAPRAGFRQRPILNDRWKSLIERRRRLSLLLGDKKWMSKNSQNMFFVPNVNGRRSNGNAFARASDSNVTSLFRQRAELINELPVGEPNVAYRQFVVMASIRKRQQNVGAIRRVRRRRTATTTFQPQVALLKAAKTLRTAE